jgi:hypothetical protein
MSPSGFLHAVLPSAGVYCLVGIKRGVQQAFYSGIEELVEAAQALDRKNSNAYFATATFEEEGSRTADNAIYQRSIFLDLDCKTTQYASKKDALAALAGFIETVGLPTPWIVSSGNGLHVYWAFTDNIPVAVWKPVAERFKRLCAKHSFLIDNAVTGDVARILRIPGTHNWKDPEHPKLVELRVSGQPEANDWDEFAALVKEAVNGHDIIEDRPIDALPGQRLKAAPDAVGMKLAESSTVRFRDVLQRTQQGKGCAQIAYYAEHAADDGMEPLWRAMLSITKHCTDSEKASVFMSDLHPYEHPRMRVKLRDIKGPYACTKIDGINPGVCPACPHWGKITNPLALGRKVAEASANSVIQHTEIPQINYPRPPAPFGFFYGAKGGVFAKEVKQYSDGDEDEVERCVVPYDVYVTDTMKSGADGSVHIVAHRPSGMLDVVMPSKSLVSKDETLKFLASHNVVAATGQDAKFYHFIRAGAGDMLHSRVERNMPDQFGWQPDGSFVLNNKQISKGDVRVVPVSPELVNLVANTTPSGTLDNWRAVVNLFIAKKKHDILFSMLTGFASPLMEFTGHNGVAIHVQSHASGTGKTISLMLAASVFGHPARSFVSIQSSVLATIHRMGLQNSLVVPIDEVTTKTRSTTEGAVGWAKEFLLAVTQGKGKERIDGATIKERRNITQWKLLALLSSNTSIIDGLTSSTTTTEGEINRLLEIEMHEPLGLTREEEQLVGTLADNYGYAGYQFIKWVCDNKDIARAVVKQVGDELQSTFSARGTERFWMAGITAIISAALLVSPKYANVIKLPVHAIMEFAWSLLQKMRAAAHTNTRTANDILNTFVREYHPNLLILRKKNDAVIAQMGLQDITEETPTRTKVRGRVEHGFKPGVVTLYIERTVLNQHCYEMTFNSTAFISELRQNFHVNDDVRKSLFANTKTVGPRVRCVAIDIPEAQWRDVDG